MMVLRSLARRRLRTGLTVMGVAIAVFAFVIMGALGERLRLHVENSRTYYGRYAWVMEKSSFFGAGGRIDVSLRDEIEKLPGVEYAALRIIAPLDMNQAFSGAPWEMSALVGMDLDERRCILREMALLEGRQMEPNSRGEAILGYGVAEKYKKRVGDIIEAQGTPLRVVGVLDLIGSDPDMAVFTSIDDAREILGYGSLQVGLLALRVAEGADEERLSQQIEELGGGRLHAMTPSDVEREVRTATSFMNSILYGCSIVAVIVGTLGIMNTMAMSVGERAREIATKKAVGATTTDIFREFLLEAVAIAALGVVVGVALGIAGAGVLNRTIESHGLPIFAVTGRLVALACCLAFIVGGLAGVFPALRAARLDPIAVLRSL